MNIFLKVMSRSIAMEKARLERIRSIELNTPPEKFREKRITFSLIQHGEQAMIQELNEIQKIIDDMHDLESLSAEIAVIRGDYIKRGKFSN